MTPQDRLSILLTFVFGVFVGGYVYVTGFATTFELPSVTTENIYTSFSLTGENYGECKDSHTCLSFQLLENGSYRALYDSFGTNRDVVKEGSVPRALRKELIQALTTEALLPQTNSKDQLNCKFGQDTNNYKFNITINSVDYTLDTCLTDIDYEGPAWKALAKLWNYFANLSAEIN